jgi:hypothetical protein
MTEAEESSEMSINSLRIGDAISKEKKNSKILFVHCTKISICHKTEKKNCFEPHQYYG